MDDEKSAVPADPDGTDAAAPRVVPVAARRHSRYFREHANGAKEQLGSGTHYSSTRLRSEGAGDDTASDAGEGEESEEVDAAKISEENAKIKADMVTDEEAGDQDEATFPARIAMPSVILPPLMRPDYPATVPPRAGDVRAVTANSTATKAPPSIPGRSPPARAARPNDSRSPHRRSHSAASSSSASSASFSPLPPPPAPCPPPSLPAPFSSAPASSATPPDAAPGASSHGVCDTDGVTRPPRASPGAPGVSQPQVTDVEPALTAGSLRARREVPLLLRTASEAPLPLIALEGRLCGLEKRKRDVHTVFFGHL